MVSGHVCADVTLVSRDGWGEDGSDAELWKGTAFRLSGLLRVNCEAELLVTCSLTGGIQNLLQQRPCEGAKPDSRAKFGKETVAGAQRRPKWVPHYGAQADSGRAQDTQALLRLAQALFRLCSGSAQACSGSAPACSPSAQVGSPSAQVKAAVAHVRRLKRNQRKGKLILSLWVFGATVLLVEGFAPVLFPVDTATQKCQSNSTSCWSTKLNLLPS